MSIRRANYTTRARLTIAARRLTIAALTVLTGCAGESPVNPRREGEPPAIRISQIVTAGSANTGWVELHNPTTDSIDLSGWTIIDDTIFGPAFTIPSRMIVAPGGFAKFDERAFPFGIDPVDDIRLMSPFGVEVDRVLWIVPRP